MPNLTRIEKERITQAAEIAASGQSVKWKAFGLRLWYEAGGKQHMVFTQGSRRVYAILCAQAKAFYGEAHAEALANREKNAAKAGRATTEAPAGEAEARADEYRSRRMEKSAIPDFFAPRGVLCGVPATAADRV